MVKAKAMEEGSQPSLPLLCMQKLHLLPPELPVHSAAPTIWMPAALSLVQVMRDKFKENFQNFDIRLLNRMRNKCVCSWTCPYVCNLHIQFIYLVFHVHDLLSTCMPDSIIFQITALFTWTYHKQFKCCSSHSFCLVYDKICYCGKNCLGCWKLWV